METLLGVLASASFLEKASLLVVGAALTGIIVPVVKFHMDQSRFEQQKIFEADIARQAELVKARAKFLQDLADPVWQHQLLALRVSYDTSSEEKYKEALASYDEQSWPLLMRIRSIVGGARWFTSEPAYDALTKFVDGWIVTELDVALRRERQRGREGSHWLAFNQWLYSESRKKTDALIVTLAEDFGLAPADITSLASRRAKQLAIPKATPKI